MTERETKTASLSELARMRDQGKLFHDLNAPEAESLGASFWDAAKVEAPAKPRSVLPKT
ncbi:hypothetical protein RMR21_025550 (plasmid) [Agrobacterium sp. rho-8.1]|nr:hypothetical protein [Agrobacterium sp. rho-8.1]